MKELKITKEKILDLAYRVTGRKLEPMTEEEFERETQRRENELIRKEFLFRNRDLFVKSWNTDIQNTRFVALKNENGIDERVSIMKRLNDVLKAISERNNTIIFGNTGRGKTTLALECCYRLKQDNHLNRVFYARHSWLISDFKSRFSNIQSAISKIFTLDEIGIGDRLASPKVIVIDEIHDTANTNDFVMLNEIIHTAYERKIPLILIGNCNVSFIEKNLSDTALSRLSNCLAISDTGEDMRKIQPKNLF